MYVTILCKEPSRDRVSRLPPLVMGIRYDKTQNIFPVLYIFTGLSVLDYSRAIYGLISMTLCKRAKEQKSNIQTLYVKKCIPIWATCCIDF